MQRNLVVHLSKIPKESSTIASVRIANLIARELSSKNHQCEIRDKFVEDHTNGLIEDPASSCSYDNVFIVNSQSSFATPAFLDQLVQICRGAKRIIWVMNDYTIYPPTQLRTYLYDSKRKLELWGTLPKLPVQYRERKTYGNIEPFAKHVINWNALTYQTNVPRMWPENEGIVYWGAFRQDRFQDFARYLLGAGITYPVTISTSKKAQENWQINGKHAHLTFVDPFKDLIRDIQGWPATVYMEDEFSHRTFCQPANRFYEALAAGIAIFVERDAVKTLKEAGFDVPHEHIVHNSVDVSIKLQHADAIALEQRNLWGTDKFYNYDVEVQFRKILTEEGISW